ncbi:MAG: HlyD family efflux transporter periplasmic adaptor subunit [Chthoniobacteraceae bacterium]
MPQEQTIDAARLRIQRLVDEIAQLSKKELRSEEYFREFLARVVQACDAKGGAVWLVGQRGQDGKSSFELAAQVEFESSLFQTDESQRAVILRMLTDTVVEKKPHVLPPAHQQPQHAPGSLEAQLAQIQPQATPQSPNRTPYPFLHVPLYLKEQVLGVLQVWMQPYVAPAHYQEFATFLSSLATHVEQHLQGRRLGNLVVEVNRLQHVLKFSNDLAGTLDPLEAARLGANYGRDLIGCERCSVLTWRGGRWQVLAISGQEVVEKKSSMVKAMAAFVGAHAQPETVLLSKKELLARAEAGSAENGELPPATEDGEKALVLRRTDEIDLAYFQLSHVVSAAVAPMLNADKELVGALFAESTAEGFFDSTAGSKELAQSQRLTEFLASHLGRVIVAAQDYQSLPFLAVTRRMRDAQLAVTGPHRRKVLLKVAAVAAIIVAILLYPKVDTVEGNCGLQPMDRSSVVPEVPGRIEKVFVREGSRVKKGEPIAQLDKFRFETELSKLAQDKLRLENEAKRLSGQGDEASAQIASLEARSAAEQEKILRADLEATTLRAPIDGRVLTKDIELRAGEFIQPGSPFAEIAGLDRWEVQAEVPEKQIGSIEERFPSDGTGEPVDLSFILYSQSAHTFRTQLARREQISAVAYPREKENVFIVTVPEVAVPDSLKEALRPGLTGRAKIELGRKPLVMIWGRKIANWARLKWLG